jgi:hypothetical protein
MKKVSMMMVLMTVLMSFSSFGQESASMSLLVNEKNTIGFNSTLGFKNVYTIFGASLQSSHSNPTTTGQIRLGLGSIINKNLYIGSALGINAITNTNSDDFKITQKIKFNYILDIHYFYNDMIGINYNFNEITGNQFGVVFRGFEN